MIGEFAPALCLDTNIRAAPVQPGLSNDDRPVERLHATYVCITRASVWEHWWQSRYPDSCSRRTVSPRSTSAVHGMRSWMCTP